MLTSIALLQSKLNIWIMGVSLNPCEGDGNHEARQA